VYGGVSVGLDWVFFFLGALCCKQAEKKKQCLDFPDAALLIPWSWRVTTIF
jgi:hypothetical protein